MNAYPVLARTLLLWVLGGVLVFAGFGFLWWTLLDAPTADTVIVIPAGTADALASGSQASAIPDSIELGPGSKLQVENRDSAAHRLGDWTVLPGEVLVIERGTASGSLACSFHPGGVLAVGETTRGGLLLTMLAPGLILGVPVGLLCGIAIMVASRLGVSAAPGASGEETA